MHIAKLTLNLALIITVAQAWFIHPQPAEANTEVVSVPQPNPSTRDINTPPEDPKIINIRIPRLSTDPKGSTHLGIGYGPYPWSGPWKIYGQDPMGTWRLIPGSSEVTSDSKSLDSSYPFMLLAARTNYVAQTPKGYAFKLVASPRVGRDKYVNYESQVFYMQDGAAIIKRKQKLYKMAHKAIMHGDKEMMSQLTKIADDNESGWEADVVRMALLKVGQDKIKEETDLGVFGTGNGWNNGVIL